VTNTAGQFRNPPFPGNASICPQVKLPITACRPNQILPQLGQPPIPIVKIRVNFKLCRRGILAMLTHERINFPFQMPRRICIESALLHQKLDAIPGLMPPPQTIVHVAQPDLPEIRLLPPTLGR